MRAVKFGVLAVGIICCIMSLVFYGWSVGLAEAAAPAALIGVLLILLTRLPVFRGRN